MEMFRKNLNKNRTTLYLWGYKVKDDIVLSLCKFIDDNPEISKLYLDIKFLTYKGAQLISSAIFRSNIECVYLRTNKKDDERADCIEHAVASSKNKEIFGVWKTAIS